MSPELVETLTALLGEGGYVPGHEPQSHDISTVGGWVATRAVGRLSSGYSGIEGLGAGPEAVLRWGRTISTLGSSAP